MGLEFLARVRRTTLGLAVVAGLAMTTYKGPLAGLGTDGAVRPYPDAI